MASFKFSNTLDFSKLKEGDSIDFGTYSFTKSADGLFKQLSSQGGTPASPSPTTPAATPPPAVTPGATPPAPGSTPTTTPTPPILPTTNTSGVITSQGATSPASSPSAPPASGVVPPQPGIGIAGMAFSQPIPQMPSMEKIMSESHIPTLQSYLTGIQQSQMQLQDAYKAYVLGINGEGTPQGIVDVLTNEKAKGMQIQMDTLNEQEALASSNLSNAMTWVNMYMGAASTDYQNAVTAYKDQFDRAYSIQTMYNDTATKEQNNASAYLSTVANMIGTTGIDWATAPASMKATVQAMELQAGWPEGTLETFAKIKPGANILGTVNGVDPTTGHNTTSFIYGGPDGQPNVIKTIVLPTSPVSLFSNYGTGSGSSSGNGYTGTILKGTGLDPQATVKDIVKNPQQMTALFAAMAQAEGGANAAGAQANNPLDLKFNSDMAKLGATDSGIKAQDGGTFASFKDQATAEKAYTSVFSSSAYSNLSVDQALQKWSGYKDPNAGSTNTNVQSWVTAIQNGNATMAQVPNTGPDRGLKDAVSQALAATDQASYSPLASSRFTTAANRIVNNFIQLPQYQLTANGLPYLQRIDAAMKNPGSISDQDLLDSLTKLNTAGNAISDAQVKLITDGQSFADMAAAFGNKFKNGGVLSDSQRGQIQKIAQAIYKNYQTGYQPVYDQATSQLEAAGIPKAFWTIPDLNNLSAGAGGTGTNTNSGSTATSGTTSSGVSWTIIP